MRRPLKPFVTEYKGSARRVATGLREAASSETPKSALKPLDFAFPLEVEDTYEAAMRAADALFAPQRPTPSAPASTEPEPAKASSVDAKPADMPNVAERPMGRILRVLDEPPLPDALALAALEAERAPKRRGRKPGSKNKPKPTIANTPAADSTITARSAAPAADVSADRAELGGQVAPVMARAAVAARRVTALPADAAPAAAKGPKRFSWVKDRLRPGEDWKRRRLPKVCW